MPLPQAGDHARPAPDARQPSPGATREPPAATKPSPGAKKSPAAATKPASVTMPALDRRTRHKLARGTAAIDARIDLHGLTQSEAHAALRGFLRGAHERGARHVLVITGKGGRVGGGVLKRQVPLWLQSAELRHFVVSFEGAHVGHGGEGALYVQVRRLRAD
ncbi:MAG: Smr/MutS family protein [Proteobacteria bacterium]|nr:Smr/MutS family protein [Pseudomonadota bacterium]